MNKINSQKGFVVPLLIVVIVVLAAGMVYMTVKNSQKQISNDSPTNIVQDSTNNTVTTSGIKIYSISQVSGPVGTQLVLKGNFTEGDYGGPEYSTQVVMVNSYGNKATIELMPRNDTATFTIQNEMCTVSTGGSGKPCPTPITIAPGTYQIYYENTYLKQVSNSITFTVTPTLVSSSSDWKTYTDSVLNLSFKYPSTWTVLVVNNADYKGDTLIPPNEAGTSKGVNISQTTCESIIKTHPGKIIDCKEVGYVSVYYGIPPNSQIDDAFDAIASSISINN